MRAIRRILVAIKDPAARSLPAVDKAAQLARALGAQLELFHGIATPLYIDTYSVSETLPLIERRTRSDYTKQLEKLAARLRRKGLQVTACAEWDYPVYEAIVRRAATIKADLIVAERHAGRHIAPGILQLTDWELLRASPVPVLLVKTAQPYVRPTVLAAVDPSHAFAKPAKLDDEVLSAGSIIASALRGALHAVHAYIPLPVGAFPADVLTEQTVEAVTAQTAAAARRRFDHALRSTRIPRARRHLIGLHPIDAIERAARDTHSAIVVMGAISRSGLKRLFIGNTAEALLDRLACDFLIVKPARFASRVQKQRRGVHIAAIVSMAGV